MPPDIPTTQRSWDIADIEGAEDDEVTLVSPEYAFVVLLVVDVVLLDDPLS
jgi:hypothetical protein